MKKAFVIVVLILFSNAGFAQFNLGFRFSPTITGTRTLIDSDTLSFSGAGALNVSLGPIANFQLKENYYFTTGLLLVSKQAAIEVHNENTSLTTKEAYKLQYLQIPLALKLLTNEVALDKRIYVEVGTALEMNVKEAPKDKTQTYVDNFKFFGTSLALGIGLEYKIGLTTTLTGGISYHRGLNNTVADAIPLDDKLIIKNDYFGFDLGVIF